MAEDVTKFIPPKHRNNLPPADPARLVEDGLTAHRVVVEERDGLKTELAAAHLKIAELETTIETIERNYNLVDSRVKACVLERDQAVREAGELRGMLTAIDAILAAADRNGAAAAEQKDVDAGE